MAKSPSSAPDSARAALGRTEDEAHGLADRLPDIVVEAMRISATVAHGIHGRRRAGPGETFWQFRQYNELDAATLIDWRRSASSDHLFVREREWEAAHTIWLWPDLSPSMAFRSDLSATMKRDRALVLALACAELLVRGGERVGLLGVGRATASRKAASRLAETIAINVSSPELTRSLPPEVRVPRFSGVLLFSDFLDPVPDIKRRLDVIAAAGSVGHLVQVLDPAEETLPYEGRAEFLGLEGGERWIADRAESLRGRYREKLEAHRAELTEAARRLGWSVLVHHTDRSAAEPILSLVMRLAGQAGDYRFQAAGGTASAGRPPPTDPIAAEPSS